MATSIFFAITELHALLCDWRDMDNFPKSI